MLNKVKEVLGVEAQEVKLAEATLANGTIIEAEEFAEGKEVFIVTEDERVPLPIGDYELEDGQILIVSEEGIIASIGAAEEAPEEAPAEEEVEAEDKPKEEMGYATKEELQEVKTMVEEIKALLEPKDQEMSDDISTGVKSEETTTKTVYAEKEEMSEVEKVSHNPESESKRNTNLYSQKRSGNTLDKVMDRISNFK